MSLCVIVTHAKDDVDRATIAFTLANAALDSGERVAIVLASEGVRLAVKGYADSLNNGEPFKPLKSLMTEVLTKGAQLNVCTPCMKKRSIRDEEILHHTNVRLIAGADVIRILKQTDRSLQF